MSKLVRPPSPAMLVALLALCVALGGTVYAANHINGKQIKKGSEPGNRLKTDTVTGKQVRESSLETVPDAANANTLQGQGPDAFAPSGLEAAHVVGAPGEPYTNGWTEPTASVDERLSFYKDPYGIVHLQGSASHSGPSAASVFTLPPGYRPAEFLYFIVYGGSGDATNLQVTPDGQVGVVFGGGESFLSLSNVSFRAGL